MGRAPVALVASLCVLASGAVAHAAAGDPWKPLRRPLHLPSLAVGEPCPFSQVRRRQGVADALGEEPPWVHPFPGGYLPLSRARPRRDGWFAYRVGWIAPRRLAGHVLVRGRRIDRLGPLRFAATATARPRAELRLTFTASRRARPHRAWLLVRSPGCFGLQQDGATFSGTLVFGARLSS
ncbi:MAG: hypothetical protein ICV64_00960 [Thermoleophilia bacterium]|nr:hypothetical protein [Thermoleophilia bacterium]